MPIAHDRPAPVAASAEEARNPRRDIPFAIIGTVLLATLLYALVSAVLTGIAPFATLNNASPIATAFGNLHIGWIGNVIVVASIIALTKGLLLIDYAQVRLTFAMCRDRLLPRGLAETGKRATPVRLTLLLGVVCATIAGLLPIDIVVELVNIGALSAFAVVCVGVLVLRELEPNWERPFRTPLVPLVPILALIGCVLLATTLNGLTWVRFAVWVVVGIAVYLGYGRKRPPSLRRPQLTRRFLPTVTGAKFAMGSCANVFGVIASRWRIRHALWGRATAHTPRGRAGEDDDPICPMTRSRSES